MTQPTTEEATVQQSSRRGRGPNKPFPIMKFEDVLVLPQAILEHGANRQIRRITLFDRLGKSPESGPSRQLVTSSSRYGVTSGGSHAEYIAVTDTGAEILVSDQPTEESLSKKFHCAVGQFEVFRQTYDKLVDQRVPANDVLEDLLRQNGVHQSDLKTAADVFVANLRLLGLIRHLSGAERIISISQLLEELPTNSEDNSPELPNTEPPIETLTSADNDGKPVLATNRPDLHIDIQVHIDPTSSAEQIDQIFASMAKHLYRTES